MEELPTKPGWFRFSSHYFRFKYFKGLQRTQCSCQGACFAQGVSPSIVLVFYHLAAVCVNQRDDVALESVCASARILQGRQRKIYGNVKIEATASDGAENASDHFVTSFLVLGHRKGGASFRSSAFYGKHWNAEVSGDLTTSIVLSYSTFLSIDDIFKIIFYILTLNFSLPQKEHWRVASTQWPFWILDPWRLFMQRI